MGHRALPRPAPRAPASLLLWPRAAGARRQGHETVPSSGLGPDWLGRQDQNALVSSFVFKLKGKLDLSSRSQPAPAPAALKTSEQCWAHGACPLECWFWWARRMRRQSQGALFGAEHGNKTARREAATAHSSSTAALHLKEEGEGRALRWRFPPSFGPIMCPRGTTHEYMWLYVPG